MLFGNHACWQEMDGLVGVSVMQHKKTKTNGGDMAVHACIVSPFLAKSENIIFYFMKKGFNSRIGGGYN